MHDARARRMARRKVARAPELVSYADKEPSAVASMLGGLIEANVASRTARRKDFESLTARVGIWVTDIDEGVTLDFGSGRLVVHNGLQPKRAEVILAGACIVRTILTLLGLDAFTVSDRGLRHGLLVERFG